MGPFSTSRSCRSRARPSAPKSIRLSISVTCRNPTSADTSRICSPTMTPNALRAGDQAEAVYAHSEAEHHYQTALELAREVGDPASEAQARERLGQVLSRSEEH